MVALLSDRATMPDEFYAKYLPNTYGLSEEEIEKLKKERADAQSYEKSATLGNPIMIAL